MRHSKQTWSVIIFCFNEVGTVHNVTREAIDVLGMMSNDFEVIVVDDGSTDGSSDEIDLAAQHEKVTAIHHPNNLGIGEALRSGYQQASMENVVAIAADGEFKMDELLPHALMESNTFVSFYRKVNTTYSSYRDMLSIVNRKLNKWLLNMDLKDVNWSNIYKTADVKSLNLELTSSLVESEICAKLIKKGVKPVESPSTYLERVSGKSKGGSMKIVWQAVQDIFKLIAVVTRYNP